MGDRSAVTARPEAPVPPAEPPGRVAAVVYAACLTWWAASWDLRNSVLMSWCPVEPIWVGAVAVAICVVHRLGGRTVLSAHRWWPVGVLLLGFLPGAMASEAGGHGPVKVAALALQLLPVVAAALLLLDTGRARAGWAGVQAVVGGVVALAVVASGDASVVLSSARLTLPTVDTIASGRLVGVAVVVLLLVGLTAGHWRWLAWPAALGAGVVLVQVGSRGPLLAVVVTAIAVALLARRFATRRLLAAAAVALAAAAGWVYAGVSGTAGGARIRESLSEGLEDGARTDLLRDAVQLGAARPMGVGWGDFASESAAGAAIANDEGVAYAHNLFAEAFAEGGPLALVAVSAVVVVALLRLQRVSGSASGLIALGVALYWLLNAQVSADLLGNRFLWIALACGWAATERCGAESGHPARDRGGHAVVAGVAPPAGGARTIP